MGRNASGTADARGSAASRGFSYPLKLSSNGRYLVDQRNVPFLIVGDSPQAMIGNLSVKDAAAYIANRKAAGFNSLLVDLLCAKYTGCRDDGTTFDGIKPFTTPGDLSTPNPAYFARADAIIRLAAKAGMVVFLDPIETGGWLGVLRSNGVAKDSRLRSVPRCSGTRASGTSCGPTATTFRRGATRPTTPSCSPSRKGIRSVDQRAHPDGRARLPR